MAGGEATARDCHHGFEARIGEARYLGMLRGVNGGVFRGAYLQLWLYPIQTAHSQNSPQNPPWMLSLSIAFHPPCPSPRPICTARLLPTIGICCRRASPPARESSSRP